MISLPELELAIAADRVAQAERSAVAQLADATFAAGSCCKAGCRHHHRRRDGAHWVRECLAPDASACPGVPA